MKNLLKKEGLFLHYLIKLSDSDKKRVLKNLTPSQVTALSGIIFNGVRKSFPLSKSDLKVLKKYNSSWRIIVRKNSGYKRKKSELVKRVREVSIILRAALKWIPLQNGS